MGGDMRCEDLADEGSELLCLDSYILLLVLMPHVSFAREACIRHCYSLSFQLVSQLHEVCETFLELPLPSRCRHDSHHVQCRRAMPCPCLPGIGRVEPAV